MKKIYTLLCAVLLLQLSWIERIHAQESESSGNDAYELMTQFYNDNFNPFEKGNAYVGFAFSLTDKKQENDQNLFLTVVDGKDLVYSITFKGGYFIGDNSMLGANFIYEREEFTGAVITDADTINRNYVRRLGTMTPVLKSYFPLTKNQRLSFYTELGFGVGFGKGVSRDIANEDEITKVNSEEFVFSAGISPGINFFAIENFAFEIQLNNLIGYTYRQSDELTNDVEKAKVVTNNVNFNINLLALRIGLAYYFGTKKR